jgi:hypothetical protein
MENKSKTGIILAQVDGPRERDQEKMERFEIIFFFELV